MKKFTAREVAESVGLSYCYFLQKVKAGDFPHHRLSPKRIFFTQEDIDAIIVNSAVPAKSAKVAGGANE